MLETVREYALERLQASGEAETILRQHAAFFLALAEQAEPELLGPRQAAWFDRLDYEYQNLRAALTWSLDRQETEIGLRLGGALWRFWAIRGHLREGRHWLTALLALAPMRTSVRGKALNSAGYVALWQADYATARVLHEESLAIGRELDDGQIIAWSLNNLGLVARFAGDYPRARALFEEALEICRRLGNPTLEAFVLNHLARVAYYESGYATARAQHEESLAMRRECGDQWGIAHSLSDLADVALAQGEYQTARKSLMESLSIFQELGDRQTAVHCLEGFAAVAAAHSQPERAVRLLGAVAAVRDAMGGPGSPARRANLERILAGAHHSLSAEAYAAAWAAGRAMPLDEAVDYTLATEHDPAGATAAAGKSTVSGQAAVLTPREQEVAELIARGLTNRQIAAELIVAERTVDAHVYNMLSKLGFRSRAQVAGWAVEQGLLKRSLEKI
jgi:DNA-binding NarL/FixJ family response regulator